MKKTFLTLGFSLLVLNFLHAQTPLSHYKIANRIHVDSNGGWDYITADDESGKLYVSHGTIVQVVDPNTSKVIGIIPNLHGVHGIAIASKLNKGFITSGKDTSCYVFNLKTNATLARIKVSGVGPDAIVYDKTTQRIFTMNGKSGNATVIDAKTNAIVGTIPLDGKPEFCVSDGNGKLYVNLEDTNAIEEIDAKEMKVLKHWFIKPGESPSGLAMDVKKRRLFSVCDNKMMVISDADKGAVIKTVPIGERPDAAAFDPEKMRAYSSNGDGTITVVQDSADTYTVLENFRTQRGARTIAINTKNHHLYLPVSEMTPLPPVRAGVEKPRPKPKPGTFTVIDVEPID